MSPKTMSSPVARCATAAATAVTLALSLAACSSASTASEPAAAAADQVKDLKVGAPTSLAGLGLRASIEEGDFTKAGLTVTAAANKSANDAVPQLLSGAEQVAVLDTITYMQARSQGIPVKIIAGAGEQSTEGDAGTMSAATVVAKSGSAISSAKDLVGKKVAVPGIKTQTWMNIRAAVDQAGGDSSKVNFVEASGPQMIDMVTQGTVDAATAAEPLGSASIASGQVKAVINTDAPGNKGVPSSVYVATEDFISKNPETVKKFTDAIYQGATQLNGHRDLSVKIAQDQLNYKPEQLKNAFFITLSTAPVDPARLDALSALAVKYGILDKNLNGQDLLASSK
jgi:NitT/TauT family transport system substrate-binding protein